MSLPSLLESIGPREIWPHEAWDFTPWLANNLFFLADPLNMELELEATEKSVGDFRADIVCRNAVDNSRIVIENQLEKSDHSHLGQVLTYAAGLQAVTLVWVTPKIRPEHRATLDWHNEITDARFRFFGVELRTWRDKKSRYMAQPIIVSKPAGWTAPDSSTLYHISKEENKK